MLSILDRADTFPLHLREAQQLLDLLSQLFPSAKASIQVAAGAGVKILDIRKFVQAAPAFRWKEILDLAAQADLTRTLAQQVRDRLPENSPRRPFLDDLLADKKTKTESEPRSADGAPRFIAGTDDVSDPEALLYYDDLTIPIGRLPRLIQTLECLVTLAPSVCKLEVDVHGHQMSGTAFRIASDLLLTNWHVLHKEDGTRATAVTAEFGYEDDGRGGALSPQEIPCDVPSIITDRDDDWAVIRANQPLKAEWPVVHLSKAAAPMVGSAAYIIQHPAGQRKRLGFVRNQVASFDDRVVHYLTDTQEGSSGSPVFDAECRLIALHHAGGRPQEVLGKVPLKKNEGIRIPRIIAGLQAHRVEIQ